MSIFDEYRKKNRKEEEEGSVESSLASFRDQNDRTKSLFQDKGYAEVTSNARSQINTSDSIRKFRENNIAQRDYEIAEREYMASLPNDAYRDAYTRSKDTDGIYVSPYFKTGTEGKEKLQYNNPEWNRLSEGEKKGYLEWAQQELEKESKKTRPNLERDNKYLNYAMSILNETDQTVRTIGDTHNISGNLFRAFVPDRIEDALGMNKESADTFNKDQELQIMLNMMPEEVRQYLNTGMVNLVREGQTLNSAEAIEDYLAKYYPPDVLEKLTKYARKVENIQKQQERNEDTERKMDNPFYASVVAPARQVGTDLLVKPVAGAIDFVRASSEANKGIYGEFDPLQTEAQRMAQDARYINESINSGLGPAGRFAYGTAVSAAESTARMYLAGGLAKTMPFLNTETASKVLLTGMMSTAVFNDDLNENIQKGMPLEDAIGSAVAHSVFESLFEEVSLDKLGYFQDAPVLRSKKEFIKALGKAAFVEGSEEAFTDIANELYDHYVGNYDFSEYKAFKDKYLASNPDASDAEVWWNFTKQFSWQVAQSFAGGALSSFALSSTKNMSALHRGETYIQNGKNVSDADYTRMNAFVEEMAAVNPNIANQLAEATEGGEDARRGFVKMVTDEYSNKFNKEIERADSKDKLNLVMNNVNSVMNGAISEDTFNTYNAKLVELGETPADYNTFVQNRQRTGDTTFSDLAYGSGDNAIQRNIVEASKSIGEAQENANLSESERETAISNLVNKVNANLEKAEDLITRYTAMGKALDSPEIRQFESIMPLEKIAKIHSDAKADLGLVNAAQQLPAVKRSAVVKFADNDELHRVLGKDSVGHVSALTMNEIRSNSDYYATYHFAELLSRLTGAKYALFKSDRTDKQKNGAYDPNTDTTYIDVEAGKSGKARATGGAFTHEFVHETRRKSEDLYQRLKNFVQNDLGDSWNDFVQERMKPREEGGLGLDQNKAEEEVVAEACQRMLENSETFKKYALADYNGAKTFRDKLAEFVTRLKQMLKSVFKGDIDTRVTEAINDIEGLQKEFDQVLEEVIKMPSENDAESVKQAMEGKENVVEEMVKNADGEMEIAKMSDGTIMYSETTYRSGGRSAIANALKEKGHTQAEINKVVKYIDNRLNYIREVGLEFATKSFDKLAKNLETDITTDLATEAEILKRIEESGVISQEVINNLRSAHQIAYAYVSNGDYPMNIDLQLSCKKRIAYEMIINRMIESGLMGDVRMSGEFIGEINTILAAHEFETQCLGCFVESRRLQMQKWAETFVSEWNQQVEKVTGKKRANATKDDYLFHGENAAGVDDAYAAHLQLEEAIKSGERNRAGNGGIVLKERSVFNKMGELIGFNKEFYGKFLTVEDILTADGLKKLRALDNGNLFSLVKSRYGVASPKILQSFNPYNSEVLNLTFKSVSEMTGNSVAGAQDYLNAAKKNLTAADTAEINRIIDENYDGKNLTKSQRDELLKEMTARKVENNAIRQYLLDIGGNRIQSFSDFMIENVFDMLQIFADMSVRDYAMHGYTKEQICLRLFGMTGAKWNGSWISHNLKEMGKELSGLMPYTAENAKHGITVEVDGEKYVIQFDDYERHVREKSFIQSIGFKDAIAIMLDPRYANNVGTITIGFSDKHIRAMLNSPYFRMVIPYHASGMIPGFAELVGASTYNDYTPYQTTGMNEIIVYENGTRKVLSAKEVKEKGEESVTKSSKGYKFTYKGTTYTVKPNMSFRFNEALQRLGDARAAAQEYVDWCRSEHALNIDGIDAYATFSPAFSNSPTGYDFTQEENYYKLLEDFNVYNSREEIINGTKVNARQEGVKLLYPGDEGGTLSAAELKQYEADLKQTGLFSDAEIQKYVKKAQMTFDELVRGEVSNRNAYYEGVFGKNNEKFNSAYEEIKQASEKYKRNEQVAESKEQYLKSQEKAAKAKQNGNEKLLKAPAGTYLADDSVRYASREKITIDMSDADREAILRNKTLKVYEYNGESDAEISSNLSKLNSQKKQTVEKALRNIGETFDIFKNYKNEDFEIEIFLSKGTLGESVTQGVKDAKQIAKLMPKISDAISNAIGLRVGISRYYRDTSTVDFVDLLGGYIEGDQFFPIRFGVKRSSSGENYIRVIIDSDGIKKDKVIGTNFTQSPNQASQSLPTRLSTISLPELFRNVKDDSLLRYIPDGFLDAQQIAAKYAAIARTVKRTNDKNDLHYREFIAANNMNAARAMVKKAAEINGFELSNSGKTATLKSDPSISESAETIIYDQNGDIVPISERFVSNVIRFASRNTESRSIEEINDDYMKAYESGDEQLMQSLVEEAAKRAGYVLSAYHGTGEFFNTFMRGAEGIHLGDESQAKQVAHSRYDIRSKNTRYDWKAIENDIPKMNAETRWSLVGQAYTLEDYYDADEYGKPFDGDINDDDAVLNYVKNEVDKYKDATKGYKYGNDVSFNLKTFDRKTGENVLHLYAKISNPFTINGDVLQWSPDRIASILLLRSEGATTMDKFYSDGVVNIDGSDIKLSAEHTRRLQAIADLKLKGESAWDEISNILTRHGYDGIKYLNQYEGDKQSYSYLALNPSDVKSADPVTYDDNGNVIPLTERFNDENTDIRFSSRDIANSESEMIVNAMTNDAALVDELGAKQSITAYAKAYNEIQAMEKQSLQYSQQLLKASPSEREVLYKKLIRLNRAITNKTTELTEMRSQRVLRDVLINEWAKRLDDVEWTNELTYQRTKQALERKYGEEIVSLRAKSKAKQTEIRNRFEINKRKKNIETKAKALMKMILSPTEKKHIPSILINPITELLDSIDYWTPAEGRPTTKKSESLRTRFEDFRSAINEYQKQIDDGAEQIELMFDPEFLETVDDLCNSVKGIDNVNDMSVQDIIDLDHTLTELLHLISRGNKMIKAYHYQTISEAVEATAETMDKLDTLSAKTSAKGNLRMRLNAGMADSYAFGRYAGNGTKQIIDSLSKAFEDKVSKVKQAIEFTQEVLEPYKKDLKKWSKETHEFTLSTTDANGNPNKVSLTVGQMMELYLLNKREQARGHIYGGGIRVEDRKGRYTESVKVTEEDVQEIVNYLETVPGAMEVADKLQKYGATTITGWGNEASNLMYGFAKFTEPDYWQIRSDSSALKDNENTEAALNASMYRLQNMGRTKAVKKGANNAIYVGDVFDTWSKTIDEMTSYASILPSTTDAMRWWNSRIVNESGDAVRVKKLLESKLGTDMTRVFTETIKALNGGIMGTDSLESLVKVLTGKAKAAAVAGNLRVVLQQPTAYTRAAAVIEPKYLLKALTMKPNAKEAQEHSAIAWHKAQGFYSNGLAPSLRKLVIGDGSFGENLTEKSLWLAGKADDITWGALWNASKLKVEAENKALQKGSDAYWDEVNKVFSDIINNTQVVDTPLTKSTWMRGNGLGVFFTAFMAEPTKTYSMVMTAVEDLVRNPKSKAAQKSVALVGTVFAVNAAVNALAQALADAARDDDKEKSYWEKYVEKYTEDIKDNLNPLTYIPVVKDIFSLMQGYSNNNLAMQAAQNTVYAVQELQKIAKGTSKKTLFGQMETVAKAVSGWTGVPFGNVMRTLNSFGNIVGIDTFRRKKYTNSELGRNIALSINEGNFEEADQYMAELLQNVNGDAKKAQNYLVTYLAENDNEIDLWTTRYIEDPTVMDDAVSAMSDKYSADVIMSAIRKSANAQGEDVGSKSLANGTSVYTGNDINRTLEKGDVQKAQEMIDDVNKAYAAAGSNSTAKSTITTYWKPKYLAASGTERDRILRMLYSLRSNGKQMYTAKEIAKWK